MERPDEIAARIRVWRELTKVDDYCFKACIKQPEQRLTKEQESCLSRSQI